MGSRPIVETRRDRKALVADAGFTQFSLMSVFAGVLAAYGTFAVLASLAVGAVKATKINIDLSAQWRALGTAGGFVVAGLLLVAYLFGGYVAGRMARRAGVLHGVGVFVLGVAVAAGAAALARRLGGDAVAASNLRDLGVPTTASEWSDIATVAGIASLVAMLLGALAGGILGERWHAKLLARALDPAVGAEAEELRTASFRRVRATTPPRTRRVDREAVARDDDTVALQRSRPLRWAPSTGDTKTAKANAVVDRTADDALATGPPTGR